MTKLKKTAGATTALEPDRSFTWYLKIIAGLTIALIITGAGCEPQKITPVGGDFTGPVTVTLNYEEGAEVWYTLDGSEPNSNCLVYTEPFVITQSTVVKARARVSAGMSIVNTPVVTETYNILGSDSGGGDDSTNGLMINDWIEYEAATRQVFADRYFGGCEPVVGCGGGLNLDDLGSYLICDIDDTLNDAASCESAGGGWISWQVSQQGLGGGSTFTYNNYSYTLTSGSELQASGVIVGSFDSGGSGNTSTAGTGTTIVLSGAYNGTVDDEVLVSSRQKSGGSYTTTCSDDGCETGTVTYLVAEGPTLTRLGSTVDSCTGPPIYSVQYNFLCMSPGLGNFANLSACSGQVWDIELDEQWPEDNTYFLRLNETTTCLAAADPNLIALTLEECDGTASQRFTFSNDANGAARLVTHPDAFGGIGASCVTPLPASPFMTAVDCDTVTTEDNVTVLLATSFPAVDIDPTADLPQTPPPVATRFELTSLPGNNTRSITVTSEDGNITLTATARKGDVTENVGAESRGLGVRSSCCDLTGIQNKEDLIITFDRPVDIGSINLKGWEGPDHLRFRWEGENFEITDDSTSFWDQESVELNLKGISWFALKGQSIGTVAFLKSIEDVFESVQGE